MKCPMATCADGPMVRGRRKPDYNFTEQGLEKHLREWHGQTGRQTRQAMLCAMLGVRLDVATEPAGA